jgi:hypothetical protein
MRGASFLSLVLVAFFAVACSSSSASGTGADASVPCNENPWECPAGQTCWPTNATTFACLNAGPGALGAACANTAGTPTCGAGLACFQAIGASTGTCVAYCSTTSTSHPCTGADVCETADLGGSGGPSFSVCVAEMVGGQDSGAPTGDSSAAADAGAGDGD